MGDYQPPNADHNVGPSESSFSNASSARSTAQPASFDGSDLTGLSKSLPVPRRQRIPRACDACRRKKVRCNLSTLPASPSENESQADPASDEKPAICANCRQSGILCTFTKSPAKRGPNKGYIQQLETRLAALESSVQDDYATVPGNTLPPVGPLVPDSAIPEPKSASEVIQEPLPKKPKLSVSSRTSYNVVPGATARDTPLASGLSNPLPSGYASHLPSPTSDRPMQNHGKWHPTHASTSGLPLRSSPPGRPHPLSAPLPDVHPSSVQYWQRSHPLPQSQSLPSISRLLSDVPSLDNRWTPTAHAREHQYPDTQSLNTAHRHPGIEHAYEVAPIRPNTEDHRFAASHGGRGPSKAPHTAHKRPQSSHSPDSGSYYSGRTEASDVSYSASHQASSFGRRSDPPALQSAPKAQFEGDQSQTPVRPATAHPLSPERGGDRSAILHGNDRGGYGAAQTDIRVLERSLASTPALRTFGVPCFTTSDASLRKSSHLLGAAQQYTLHSSASSRTAADVNMWRANLGRLVSESMMPTSVALVGADAEITDVETLLLCYFETFRRGKFTSGMLAAAGGKLSTLEGRGISYKRHKACMTLISIWHCAAFVSREVYYLVPKADRPDDVYEELLSEDPDVRAVCIFSGALDSMFRRYAAGRTVKVDPETVELSLPAIIEYGITLPARQTRLLAVLDSFLLLVNFLYNCDAGDVPSLDVVGRQRHHLYNIVNECEACGADSLIVGPHILATAALSAAFCLSLVRHRASDPDDPANQRQHLDSIQGEYDSIVSDLKALTARLAAGSQTTGGDMCILYGHISLFLKRYAPSQGHSDQRDPLRADDLLAHLRTSGYIGAIMAIEEQSP